MDLTPIPPRRPNLCTVIDLANARAARAVGIPPREIAVHHGFQVGGTVRCSDGASGRVLEFKGGYALVALTGRLAGIKRTCALSTLRASAAPADPGGGDTAA
jgi:hypothetical protein